MRKHWPLLVLGVAFLGVIALNTALAWGGDNTALITLAVLSVMATVGMVGFGWGWRDALDNWGHTTEGWAAAQDWGIKQDMILRDVLNELWQYDEEAVEIHNGRSATASLEYLQFFKNEDAEEVTEILRQSMKLR